MNPDASISSPGFLEDRVTGKKREIDVLIDYGTMHHKQLIAVECRDRKVPVGVPDIEAFHSKISYLGVTKAVFVSSSGYRKSALDKASFLNISCLTLDEVESFDWLLTDFIVSHETKILKAQWLIGAEEVNSESLVGFSMFHESGVKIDQQLLEANTSELFGVLDLSSCELNKVYFHEFIVNSDGLYLIEDKSGERFSVGSVRLIIEFKKEVSEIPVKRIKYYDTATRDQAAKAAISDVSIGQIRGQFLIVENPDGSKKMSFVFDK